jgi:hypothetical protein
MDEVGNVFHVHYHSGWAYMAGYAQHLFHLQHDTQRIVAEQRCHLVGYAKEVKDLIQEISRKAQKVGAMCQQVRDFESRLRDKEEALLSLMSYFGTISFYGRLRSLPRLRLVSLRSSRPRRTWGSRVCRRS